ncbi:hypothetical protein ACQKIK_21330 [Pseudomonas sp. NPDC047961]
MIRQVRYRAHHGHLKQDQQAIDQDAAAADAARDLLASWLLKDGDVFGQNLPLYLGSASSTILPRIDQSLPSIA